MVSLMGMDMPMAANRNMKKTINRLPLQNACPREGVGRGSRLFPAPACSSAKWLGVVEMSDPLPTTTPPSYSPHELWQTALTELRQQMCEATFNLWLADSQVIAKVSHLSRMVIAVRNRYAKEWLTHRLHPVIARTVSGIAGHSVTIILVCENYTKWQEVPPKPKSYHCIKGDNPMPTQQTPFPTTSNRVRIHSHVTQSKFLHVEDALNIGKIRLFAGAYRKNNGMNTHGHHFIDLTDARVIFTALARGEQGFIHKEYKGTPPQAGSDAVSRVLSVKVKGQHVYIELKSGSGILTDTGAILPKGRRRLRLTCASSYTKHVV